LTNNDLLIRIRYALNITDLKVLELFRLAGYPMERPELDSYFRREEEAGYVECPDTILALFLDGLITSRRGKKEGPEAPVVIKTRLSNNDILKRLRIALELKDEDMAAILGLAGVEVTTSELGALFRKPGHHNYRPCGDQFLRNFLAGLTAKYRV
jgi:uncharacterized protein YehS (DUF1456 family)